jgi:hypothetical protein
MVVNCFEVRRQAVHEAQRLNEVLKLEGSREPVLRQLPARESGHDDGRRFFVRIFGFSIQGRVSDDETPSTTDLRMRSNAGVRGQLTHGAVKLAWQVPASALVRGELMHDLELGWLGRATDRPRCSRVVSALRPPRQ